MNIFTTIAALLLTSAVAHADDFAARCADRAAIERVYHAHRSGTTRSFEETMPRTLLEQLVRLDDRKAAVLGKNYGIAITPALLAAEVARINTTTRAPDVLAEIKHALGDDTARFASAMAWPILVERELRARFDNDDKLHAAQRHEAEQARAALLAATPVADMREMIWQFTPRLEEDGGQESEVRGQKSGISPSPTQGSAKSASYSVEATAQVSQPLTPPNAQPSTLNYFADLDPELQKVLRAQLQKPGDVSAVIETPAGFLILQAKERTATTLRAASLSIPKRSYEEWLAQQPQ